jgi:UDP-N-acetylmuramyl tripeptide synthase
VVPALAGSLLLALGATYEQRIRDVRRVREVLGRMS